VAGVAIATAAVVAVAGVANASTSTPRKATTLSIVAARTTITVGQVDAIGGVLKSHGTPLAGRIVVLDRFAAKKWRPIEEKVTGKHGGVDFAVKPLATTAYKLAFLGGTVYAPTHSGFVVVKVKPAIVKTPTALTIAESAATIAVGKTDTIGGGLTADAKVVPGKFVWLATVTDGKVHALRARLTDKAGVVTFTVTPTVTTTYELFYLGSKTLDATASATVTTTVTPAS
jgi:5-hydroxyisourate hydrolase-like protein (transthyretin family)